MRSKSLLFIAIVMCLCLLAVTLSSSVFAPNSYPTPVISSTKTTLSTVAIRVHYMDAMVAFYSEAFGAQFREVDTFGLASQFGDIGGITLKLVPLRKSVDFEDYPSHQLGFIVPDVKAVIALALKHGGRQEGDIVRDGGKIHAAVRDPDANTIEIYSSE